MEYRTKRPIGRVAAMAMSLVVGLSACGGGTSDNSTANGKSLTVLEDVNFAGSWPGGLDPATNPNGLANQSVMNAIYGQLFELGPKGKNIPELATGYALSNGNKTVTISLRRGVTFSDGTPFNADAVVWNIKRDAKSSCTCRPTWPMESIRATGDHSLEIHLTRPFAPLIASFYSSSANWIASPTAVRKMGEKAFSLKPVGAGPFQVVHNTPSSVLELKRNPGYWQQGRPYLSSLTFKTVGGDQAALEAMLAGQGDVYENMSTPSLLDEAAQHFTVVNQLSTSPYVLQLNTQDPPFNNKLAREALYYATDFKQIDQHIFKNLYPLTEGFTGPGGICYQPHVPGYRRYDLAKARKIVRQLGGLKVDLGTLNVLVAVETIQALQTQWAQAGIKTTIDKYDLAALIQHFSAKKWQAMLQTAGAYDPSAGIGVDARFGSGNPFSGVHDPHIDKLLSSAASTLDMKQRCKLYDETAKYISDQAYAPFFFAFAPASVMRKGVTGPGLSIKLSSVGITPSVPWEEVQAP